MARAVSRRSPCIFTSAARAAGPRGRIAIAISPRERWWTGGGESGSAARSFWVFAYSST